MSQNKKTIKNSKKIFCFSIMLIAMLLSGVFIGVQVNAAWTLTAPDIALDDLPSVADYTLKSDGLTYWAVASNGSIPTGFSSTSLVTVENAIISALTSTGGYVVCLDVLWGSTVSVPSNIIVEQKYYGYVNFIGNVTATNFDSANPMAAYDYLIYVSSGTYYAKASNGTICWSSTNANETINNVFASGNSIKFVDGTYILESTITPSSGQLIDFGAAILQVADGVSINAINLTGVTNTTLINGVIDGNKASFSTNITAGGETDGIYITDASCNIKILNMYIKDTLGWGIYVDEASYLLIDSCKIDDIQEKGIGLHGATSFATVTKCYIQTSGGGAYSAIGVEIDDGAYDITVDNNFFENTSNNAISIHSHSGTAAPKRISITNNKIIGTASSDGIRVCNHQQAVDHIYDVIISNNQIYAPKQSGIILHDNGGSGTKTNIRITVTNNQIINAGLYGVRVTRSEYANIQGNTIENPTSYAIYVSDSTNNAVVSNNVVRNGASGGIYCDESRTIISNNHIQETNSHGITISTGDRILVTGNMIINVGTTASRADGIRVQSDADYTFITNNIIVDTFAGDNRVIANGINIVDATMNVTTVRMNSISNAYTANFADAGTDTNATLNEGVDY